VKQNKLVTVASVISTITTVKRRTSVEKKLTMLVKETFDGFI
jgi:hypothetical protein